MPEWSTYSLADFLMFSPRTYWRLLEGHNRAFWPAHLVAAAWGLFALLRPRSRVVLAGVAALWLWVAWAFLWQRYAAVNWGARWVALAWALQACLLLAAVLSHRRGSVPSPRRVVAGRALAALALAYPVLLFALGRPWPRSEAFGLMPEPTALFTLGLLLAAPLPSRAWRALLLAVPALSLALGWATLRALAAVQ